MQYSLRMAMQIGYFGVAWIFPEAQLVLAETVRT